MTSFQLWAAIFLALYLGWLLFLTIRSFNKPSMELGEFFLANKSVGFFPSLLTFWATYFSAAALIGGAGYYYIHGVGNFLFASLGYVILAVIAGTLGKRLWRMSREFPDTRSPIQLYLKHFRSPLLELLFVIVSLACMVPYLAAQITGFARMLESSLGLPYVWTAAAALIIIYIYSESGGLANIIKTDVIQSLLAFGVLAEEGVAVGGQGSDGTFTWGGYFNSQYFADPKENIIGVILKQTRYQKNDDTSWQFKQLVFQSVDD